MSSLIQESHDYERAGTEKDAYSPDEVVVVPCPFCRSAERKQIYTEHRSIGISRCLSCSLIYTCPRIEAPEQVYWGDADKYYAEARLIFEGKALHHRDANYLEELRLIKRRKPSGRFLDVGCHMGMLLRHAEGMGWTAVGVEPSPSLSTLAREKLGLTVHNCFLHEFADTELFDVIALSDVFEHVSDPLVLLKDVGRLLAEDGIVYIKVPNARWNLLKQMVLASVGQYPTQGIWDSYEHVVHYTDITLRRMLESAGFEVSRIAFGRPVQAPAWHEHVGAYYQYASPWFMDWKRHLARSMFYWLAWPERLLRIGSVGYFAPNLIAVASKR